jgi:hypothetical protein
MNKKKSQIIIKTMKRGKPVKIDFKQDFIGKTLTEDEERFQAKHIDMHAIKWPEVNPILMQVKQHGRLTTLANYRYPAVN